MISLYSVKVRVMRGASGRVMGWEVGGGGREGGGGRGEKGVSGKMQQKTRVYDRNNEGESRAMPGNVQ